ncbi:hypothetical protein KAK07_02975 [Ideonella sp. 4Y16]|uniref:Uncharacterized protein n=1 Tax=Ideonella alba TaxID=2824118 RepID=A0A940Y714_9BURK|nr:choice-of-anchor R domain-containing protein [Ideonella alba]MBQ0931042.1 hypothetical protein [Ideonella alba]MBQ0942294.1 hypothetical protein [Ideonella alba]
MEYKFKSLALAAALALSGVAMAGPVKSAGGKTAVLPVTAQAVLYSQLANDAANAITSQDFESTFDAYDNRAADDFSVPAGQKWKVSEVFAPGAYFNGTGPLVSANVTFYKDKGGKPGKVVADFPLVPVTNDASGSITVTLPTAVTLKEGTYWVSVQGQMDFFVGGQWGWEINTAPTGYNAMWQNPGGGFGTGCDKYSDMNTCLGQAAGDMMFELRGKAKAVTQ